MAVLAPRATKVPVQIVFRALSLAAYGILQASVDHWTSAFVESRPEPDRHLPTPLPTLFYGCDIASLHCVLFR